MLLVIDVGNTNTVLGVFARVAKVQAGGVAAAAAEIAVSVSRDSGLLSRHRLDDDLRFRGHFERLRNAIGKLNAMAAQQTRELIFRKRIGHWRDGGEPFVRRKLL